MWYLCKCFKFDCTISVDIVLDFSMYKRKGNVDTKLKSSKTA